jgi:hypothetical protein
VNDFWMAKKWAEKISGQKIRSSFSFLFLFNLFKKWGFPSLSRSDAQGVENVSVFVS